MPHPDTPAPHKPLKVLYVAMKYDYGMPEQGPGNEHFNFYDTLVRMGCDVLYFDYKTLFNRHGRKRMNERLREVVDAEKPDLLFCVVFKHEIDMETMRKITEETQTLTLNWFSDDVFRFKGFSRRWARCFDWIITADPEFVPGYKKLGTRHAAYIRWACNPFLYKRSEDPPVYDVTFVGQPHSRRLEAVQALRDAGISVQTWGRGWEQGRVSQDEMIRIFGRSKINLNFSDASRQPGWKGRLGLTFPKQVKARLLEVPACGGFLLTGDAPLLRDYYEPGRDVGVFHSTKELVEKVRYYLSHEEERAAIAKSGYERTMREHTYPHRFEEIFRMMELPSPPARDVLDGKVPPGATKEITIDAAEPLVSVVTTVYNGARFLRPTIESVLAQAFADFEFIIIDDGSTDETPNIIAEYAARDPRIKTHRHEKNKGKVTGFNTGFAMATGKFIAVTGADDISLPNRLTMEVNFLESNPHIAAAGSWVDIIDAEGKKMRVLTHAASPALIAWSLLFRNPLAACATMVRRTMGEKIGWYRETASEDYDFIARLSAHGDIANIQFPLAQYRVWDGNFSALNSDKEEETVYMVMGETISKLLGEQIPDDAIRALRRAIARQPMTMRQIRTAAGLVRRMHRAFERSRPMSWKERQLVADNASDYDCLLAAQAKKHSLLFSLFLQSRSIVLHPFFVVRLIERAIAARK
jgi:spore maturation protein CgeB